MHGEVNEYLSYMIDHKNLEEPTLESEIRKKKIYINIRASKINSTHQMFGVV